LKFQDESQTDLEGSLPRRNSCQVLLNLPEDSLKDAEGLEYLQIYERYESVTRYDLCTEVISGLHISAIRSSLLGNYLWEMISAIDQPR